MIRTLLWKEYRELRLTAVALTAIAVATLVSFPTLSFASSPDTTTVTVIAIALVWMAGLVAGSLPLAGEVENRTQRWLDTMPVSRWQLGSTKALVAGIYLLIHAVVILTLGLMMKWIEEKYLIFSLSCMIAFGLSGLGCGLWGSAWAKSPLAAIVLALLLQMILLAVNVLYGLVLALLLMRKDDPLPLIFAALFCAPLPFILAGWRYTRFDRWRVRWARRQTAVGVHGNGWRALLWLSWRQSRGIAWGLVFGSVVLTITLCFLEATALWPPCGLLFGIIAGIGVFAADQPGEAYRFLGDRRLPFGRLWLVKPGMRLAILLAATGVFFAIDQFVAGMSLWNRPNQNNWYPEELIDHFWIRAHPSFLLLCPLYGFSIAQTLGMACRKPGIAAVLSIFLGGGVLLVWWPSIIITGLHPWQWVVPPLLLLAATRWTQRPWLAGRLDTLRPIAALLGVSTLAVVTMLGGLWYRVAEVPFTGDPFDVAAFERTLPPPEKNESGRAIDKVLRDIRPIFTGTETNLSPEANQRLSAIHNRAHEALGKNAWPVGDDELSQIVDAEFAKPWFDELQQAVALPPGMVVGDEQRGWTGAMNAFAAVEWINLRALQLVSRGQIAEAVDLTFVGLDLTRHLRSKASANAYHIGIHLETSLLRTMSALIIAAANQPELIEKNLSRLLNHIQNVAPLSDTLRLEYNRAKALLGPGLLVLNYRSGMSKLDRALLQFAAQVPWEQQRTQAILAATYAGFLRMSELPLAQANRVVAANKAVVFGSNRPRRGTGLPLQWWVHWCPADMNGNLNKQLNQINDLYQHSLLAVLGVDAGAHMWYWQNQNQGQRYAIIMKMAEMLYHHRHGKYPDQSADLVPEILPELPEPAAP